MGFGFPRDEREVLVASEPDTFLMPRSSDMRYQWVCVRLDAIVVDELPGLLVDAWRMCVPRKVAAATRNEGCISESEPKDVLRGGSRQVEADVELARRRPGVSRSA